MRKRIDRRLSETRGNGEDGGNGSTQRTGETEETQSHDNAKAFTKTRKHETADGDSCPRLLSATRWACFAGPRVEPEALRSSVPPCLFLTGVSATRPHTSSSRPRAQPISFPPACPL